MKWFLGHIGKKRRNERRYSYYKDRSKMIYHKIWNYSVFFYFQREIFHAVDVLDLDKECPLMHISKCCCCFSEYRKLSTLGTDPWSSPLNV